MPPKKSAAPKAAAAAAAPEGFTPERFERELKDLASKAKEDTASKRILTQVSTLVKAGLVLALIGVAANVSQLNLSPVYGSIPASLNHSYVLMVGAFVGWAGNLFLRRVLRPRFTTPELLPVIACYVPTVQFFLFHLSDELGPKWGPILTEVLTLFPLVVVSAASVADYLDEVQIGILPKFLAESGPGIGSWVFFRLMQSLSEGYLQTHVGKFFVLTRLGLEMLLAASYTVVAPSKLLALTVPALLHTAVLNTHVHTPLATAALNSSMQANNWTLLERKESLTGYVSVMENIEQGFRVMRCDHSLLGGEWVRFQGMEVHEPIYGVFVMLEAVRLIEREVPVKDAEATALVVGLGIGTTPSALITHGIDTTVVEIDPVVHEFAAKYFLLKENNPPVIQDAVSYTAGLVEAGQQYDYIVHDVFTGGAEPVDLFTLEFLQGLSALLKPDGVIAINYAGDFGLPSPKMIVRTIKQVFPTCRIYREAPRDEEIVKLSGSDFTNMVIFCRKTADPIQFRRALPQDFLRSHARRAFLEPKHEVQESVFLSDDDDDTQLLMRNTTGKVKEWHKESAVGHWHIMRKVIPGNVWEKW